MNRLAMFLALVLGGPALAQTAIPEPPLVLYGSVTVNGRLQLAGSGLTITARVDGAPDPVGTYVMGSNASAGDNYVLPIKLEASTAGQPVGGSRSDDAALIGEVVHITLSAGGPDSSVQDFTIVAAGTATQLPLSVTLVLDAQFKRGDCNGDSAINIADAVYMLGHLFPGPAGPNAIACFDACDANDDEGFDIGDAVATLSGLFGGMPIPAPSPDCGIDPDGDSLDCMDYSNCP